MIVQSFILGNRVSLCMKIINSVVVVGLYYGFMTTFSIGPSYLFLLRARVMEEGEEGTEKKVSATTGFIAGQLMMFISIYYAPLHLALGRPHTITVLALPYLLFHFFWNNPKHFFDYGSTTRRNLSIQCVFLNNLIFQLFNHLILTSSMLARLVNIYMFRCNNKMLFVTSSFVGWLIGHILFMKWVGLVLVWTQQKNSSRSNVLIRFNKYLVSELRNSMARIFSILLFITCIYYLGRIPSPIFTKKLKVKETSETEERDVEIETTFERRGPKQEQEVSAEEDPSPSLFSEEKEDTEKIEETEEIRVNGKEKKKTKHEFHFHFRFKETCDKNSPVYESSFLDGNQENSKFKKFELFKEKEEKFLLGFEKPVVTLLFDYKRWTRPLRYKKNNKFENAVKNEMSHYFFFTYRNDGKERISFTYPANLSTFFEMIRKKIDFFTTATEKINSHEFDTHLNYTNDQKKKNGTITREFRKRIEGLDKGSIILNILEKRDQLYNDKTKKKYLPKIYDTLLHGIFRGRLKKKTSQIILPKTYIKNKIGMLWLNKIHNIILINDYDEIEQTIDQVNQKSFSREEVGSLFTKHERDKIDSEGRIKILKILFHAVISDSNDQKFRKKSRKEIVKKVPRWSYKFIDNFTRELGKYDENVRGEHAFRERKAKRLVVSVNHQKKEDVALPRYLEQSDFRRSIIKGSLRAQRRKTVIWKPVQANAHSPLFLNRIDKPFYLSFDILGLIKVIFINYMWKNNDPKISDYKKEKPRNLGKKTKKKPKKEKYTRQKKGHMKQAEGWDNRFLTRVLRSSMLVIQLLLRKYILLPSLILAKNLGRILLFQNPEWSEDFQDWGREIYVKCTYSGVNLSETEFPKNWLTEGIQIKILFPFRLKPWHRSKIQSFQKDAKSEQEKDFCFLTVFGLETEMPFGSPRKRRSFFEPIFKELKKNIVKNKPFIVLRVFNEEKLKELSKRNLKEIDELGETKKKLILSNQKIDESSIEIPSMDWPNLSQAKKKKKDLTNRTSRIRNQISKITKGKKKRSLTQETNISSNKPTNYAKILDSSRNIWQILKKKNTRLTRKSYFFVKFFIEKLYIKFFITTLTIPRINAKSFGESTKNKIQIIEKNIHNNEENPEIIKKKNKKEIHFISTVKKSLFGISNKNSKIYSNLSSFSQSQTYVFYKLLQAPLFDFYKLRPILQYDETSLFLQDEIKDFFDKHGIFNYQLRHKPFWYFGINLWKNYISDHYQYDFYQIKWARFVPQESRNRAHQHCITQNKDLTKRDSYEKKGLTHYEKKLFFEADSLRNQKSNFKKHYRYYCLSYKSINSEDTKDSYIDRSLGQVNNKQKYYYNYNINYNINKENFFAMLGTIPINNYLGEDNSIDRDKFVYRKYFDWRILNFYLRNKVNIEAWVDMDTGTRSNQNTKKGADNYKKIDAIKKGDPFYLTIHQDEEINPSNKKKTLFDWMEMNEEILSCPLSNLEPWFFPDFALLFNAYRTKPWIIPIKLLLFNCNGNGNKIRTEKKEVDPFISSTQKEYLEFSNQSQEEQELTDQENSGSDTQKQISLGSVLSNHEKGVEENFTRSDMKECIKKKKYKRETEVQLDFFLKKYLCLQLRWRGTVSFREKILNDMKVYCYLVQLINPIDLAIASIQGGEICLPILITNKDFALTELMKGGMLIIEPRRLSVKNDSQFVIYQIVGISLVHKNKHKITKRYHEKGYIDKKKINEFFAKHQKMTGNRNKNHYDLLVPEKIFFPKFNRELRTLICFNSKNKNVMEGNPVFCTNVKKGGPFLDKNKDFSKQKNQLIKLKFVIWPKYRLEDFICMNRYWFNTNNGSRFSIVRVHMYPRLKIC
nr:Ycf1 [Boronia imlayensis]